MLPPNAKDLLEKYHNGELTETEKALVETWYLQYNDQNAQVDFVQLKKDEQESLDALLSQIAPVKVKRLWPKYAVAASLLIGIALVYFLRVAKPPQEQQIAESNIHEISPGGNRATLILANGQQIILSQAQNGKIASQGNIQVSKISSGQIVYSASAGNKPLTGNVYNTAITPRGGQFAFTLADGTRVWLDAASSLKFPVTFNGNERKVELTGEAYFEVAHNAAEPFRVVVAGQTVEDLGTEFNINAYADEAVVKTTLLHGSVKVSSAGKSDILKPGQQSQLKDGVISVNNDADLDEAVAWKNGLFYFKDADVKTIMRQMSRWYDADVTYEDNLPERQFSGEISRNINASQLLDILSFKKVHFKIEGKKIIIMR